MGTLSSKDGGEFCISVCPSASNQGGGMTPFCNSRGRELLAIRSTDPANIPCDIQLWLDPYSGGAGGAICHIAVPLCIHTPSRSAFVALRLPRSCHTHEHCNNPLFHVPSSPSSRWNSPSTNRARDSESWSKPGGSLSGECETTSAMPERRKKR